MNKANETNIIKIVKSFCPKETSVYFDQHINSITIMLDSDIGVIARNRIHAKISNHIAAKNLHNSIQHVKIVW